MIIFVKMPKLGLTMTEGVLVKWLKQEGDDVAKGEPIVEVESDKSIVEYESPETGILKKILIEEGKEVPILTDIAIIGDKNDQIPDLKEAPEKGAVEMDSKPDEIKIAAIKNDGRESGKIFATPSARRVARENNIDIGSVPKGTNKERIEKADVIALINNRNVKTTPLAKKLASLEGVALHSVSATGVNGKIIRKDIERVLADHMEEKVQTQYSSDGKEILDIIPYQGMRKLIGDRLSKSKYTAPHVYFSRSIDLAKLFILRKQVNEAQDKKTSVTDYILVAVVKALQKYPDMNASLQENKIIKYKTVNVGLAVAAESGLIVPVIKDAEKKSLIDISKATAAMIDKARDGKLLPQEYSGGTFTVSNLGMFGIETFTAIINPPEVGILAVSATEKRPIIITNKDGKDEISIRPMMKMTLSIDHRVIDGMLAAQFVGEIKEQLENPLGLLL
ncbi:MAG: 2-oxo acid dehydrogenase subunit E2 [Clostridia bacterium]|nr:2-oxo acid dehydrogenase subunit E2 [Clostridia bacterium]